MPNFKELKNQAIDNWKFQEWLGSVNLKAEQSRLSEMEIARERFESKAERLKIEIEECEKNPTFENNQKKKTALAELKEATSNLDSQVEIIKKQNKIMEDISVQIYDYQKKLQFSQE